MNSLIKLVIHYQNTKDDILFEQIIEKFRNLIYYNIRKIPNILKEEVYQELLLGLYNVLIKFKINYNITIDKSLLENYNQDTNIMNRYIIGFIKKYGDNLIKERKLDLFIEEYILFCNENQFIFYINKRFKSICIAFYQKIEKEKRKLELFHEKNIISSNYKIKNNLSEKDFEFIELFIDDGRIISQKEVASKLGISQQAVSKRLNRIKENYKKGKV